MTRLFKWGAPKAGPPATAPVEPAAGGTRTTSKVLPKLLGALKQQPSPVLLDLGPVVGSNIAFFGERLACKFHVEDLFADVEAHDKRGEGRALARVFATRLTEAPGTVNGILCWDLFDFLDRPSSQVLAGRLVQLLRPGGVLYGFFGNSSVELNHYTRFLVEGEGILRRRPYPATAVRRHVLTTRDINKMFNGLVVTESVLLKSRSREMLFRKP